MSKNEKILAGTGLSPTERRALKARAHSLEPVVMVGDQGLSAAVIREIERSLKAHELIKVRIMNDDRAQRQAWLAEIAAALHAEPVQHIGKTLVLWRLNADLELERKKAATAAARPAQRKKTPRLTRQQEENLASGKTTKTRAAPKPRPKPEPRPKLAARGRRVRTTG